MASITLNQELDSSFLKGLRLLHSSEPDAEEQLQNLWKQSIVDKYGSERTPTSVLHKIVLPSGLKRENLDAAVDPAVEVKRPKLDSSVFPKSSSSNSPQKFVSPDTEINNSSSNEESDNESPLEILNTTGVCMKCKTSTSSNNNKLVECVDCQKHYHQLCHFPPITDMDLSDPRFVWYCASCDQNITTNVSEKTKISSSSSTGSTKAASSSRNTATTTKSGRSNGSSSNKSSTAGNANNSSKTADSSLKDRPNSPNVPEKKGHMMKKRSSARKPEKKKTSK